MVGEVEPARSGGEKGLRHRRSSRYRGGRGDGGVGNRAAFGAAAWGGSQVVAASFAAPLVQAVAEFTVFAPKMQAEEDRKAEENGGNGEGDFEVPEHALVAPAAAEFHARELELLEVLAPVSAFLA